MIEHPTRCTRKCWDATHEKCTCGCGGKNHGIKKTQLDLFERENLDGKKINTQSRRLGRIHK